ncbi:MAG TPA: right-handed parallel beta-helix repeat-containing protein [Gemmatimonadaceae bacterium]|nr:right-handed parallel beta-helix repeat-containing protein [Gemmatimonadaceae bacterium]
MKRFVLAILALGCATLATDHQLGAQVPTVELRAGLVITRSVRVTPRTYRINAPASLDSAAIVIRGDDITVDFGGAVLAGTADGADPDAGAGVAIRVDGGRNVRVSNARVRGYKVGIMARGTRGLTLADNDLSDNWKPRLFSGVEHESLVDWLSFHHNEQDEWLRFGAAAYLVDVKGGAISGNRALHGMNGVLLVRSDSLRIWNNVVSFNSGIGFGLYRSSDNYIAHNHADYNVRGYSHGFYKRGQDSAALLMYEQSCRNVVAYNSMTHSGDGLFLWAGQTTMDTGEGGANDNLFFGNDFSFAPTNGMEATFSRNTFIANRIEGSDHGLWGGYSFDSKVIGNDFLRNRVGIAIEHGQNNDLSYNRFVSDTTALYLWANPVEPSDWGYPKRRDTRSRDYRVVHNVFDDQRVVVRGSATQGMQLTSNQITNADTVFVVSDTSQWIVGDHERHAAGVTGRLMAGMPAYPPELARLAPPRINGGLEPFRDSLALRPRSAIVVTEWGPYDWRAPFLVPAGAGKGPSQALRVLGPRGRWRVVRRAGIARVSRETGRTGSVSGDTVIVTPAANAAGVWDLTLEYVPDRPTRADTAARFSYRHFAPTIDWTVRTFTWSDSAADPLSDSTAFATLLRGKPASESHSAHLDYMWYRPTEPRFPQERFAIGATGRVALAAGEYTLRAISDDGVRVWIDGRLAIDSWAPHESKVDYARITPGRHELRVEYYQLKGWTELRVDIVRGTQRSAGSPGPH